MTTKQTAARRTRRSPSDRPHRRAHTYNGNKYVRRPSTGFPQIDAGLAAGLALHYLIGEGDFIQRGRRQYLVAHVNSELMEMIGIALAATEDDEENGDLEPSLGTEDDREGDGLDDLRGGEAALGWTNEGSQEHLWCCADESEPDLGWSNTGSQLRLCEGYSGGSTNEGPDDEDVGPEDIGELDMCDDELSLQSADLFRSVPL